MSTTITASHRSIRVVLEQDPNMSSLSVWSARGLERSNNFFTRDLTERVADLRKMYTYIKGEQSHYVRALDSLMVLAGVKQTENEILGRLALFLKPEFMPVTSKQIDAWVEEAGENGGYVEASRDWTLSGATEKFVL